MEENKNDFEKLKEKMNSRENIEALLEIMEYNSDLREEVNKKISKALFLRYGSLIKAGFTIDQSFAIVLHKGLML